MFYNFLWIYLKILNNSDFSRFCIYFLLLVIYFEYGFRENISHKVIHFWKKKKSNFFRLKRIQHMALHEEIFLREYNKLKFLLFHCKKCTTDTLFSTWSKFHYVYNLSKFCDSRCSFTWFIVQTMTKTDKLADF